jgi:hypothetical protein
LLRAAVLALAMTSSGSDLSFTSNDFIPLLECSGTVTAPNLKRNCRKRQRNCPIKSGGSAVCHRVQRLTGAKKAAEAAFFGVV